MTKIPFVRKADTSIFIVFVLYNIFVVLLFALEDYTIQCAVPIAFCNIISFLAAGLRSGVMQNIWASGFIGGCVYFARTSIRSFFANSEIRVRSPLMLAAAPIILAEDSSIWKRVDYNLRIDFKYAGFSALDDLHRSKCTAAVVSDIALVNFLFDNKQDNPRFFVIPFTKITDNIRFVVRKSGQTSLEFSTLNDLRRTGVKVGYMKDTVHEHFLEKYLEGVNFVREYVNSPIEGLGHLLSKKIDALVLWEPHYVAFEGSNGDGIAGVGLVEPSESSAYSWFLCLVTKRDYLVEDDRLRQSMIQAIENAAERCTGSQDQTVSKEAVHKCYERMNGEFMGLDESSYYESLDNNKNFRFGVEANKVDFKIRVEDLMKSSKFNAGAMATRGMMWYDYRD